MYDNARNSITFAKDELIRQISNTTEFFIYSTPRIILDMIYALIFPRFWLGKSYAILPHP